MTRLVACLIVLALMSSAFAASEDKNWGDKQSKVGKKSPEGNKPEPASRQRVDDSAGATVIRGVGTGLGKVKGQ
jgi:hypothetical protein